MSQSSFLSSNRRKQISMAQGFKAAPKKDPKKATHVKAKPVTKGARTFAPNKKATIADKNRVSGTRKMATPQTIERLIVGKADGDGHLKLLQPATSLEITKAKGKRKAKTG